MCHSICGGSECSSKNQCCLSTMWGLGIKLKSWDLAAGSSSPEPSNQHAICRVPKKPWVNVERVLSKYVLLTWTLPYQWPVIQMNQNLRKASPLWGSEGWQSLPLVQAQMLKVHESTSVYEWLTNICNTSSCNFILWCLKLLTYRDLLRRQVNTCPCIVLNKHADIPSCCVVGTALSEYAQPNWAQISFPYTLENISILILWEGTGNIATSIQAEKTLYKCKMF